jgi:hypothetical protein
MPNYMDIYLLVVVLVVGFDVVVAVDSFALKINSIRKT